MIKNMNSNRAMYINPAFPQTKGSDIKRFHKNQASTLISLSKNKDRFG